MSHRERLCFGSSLELGGGGWFGEMLGSGYGSWRVEEIVGWGGYVS